MKHNHQQYMDNRQASIPTGMGHMTNQHQQDMKHIGKLTPAGHGTYKKSAPTGQGKYEESTPISQGTHDTSTPT